METPQNPFSLTNKTILITGASSGIGRECALACSRMGADVIILGRNNPRLKETFGLLRESDQNLFFSVDLLNYNEIEEILTKLVSNKIKIDGLVNCAGISTTLPFKMTSPEKMDEFFHTNVHASINLSRMALKHSLFPKEGGSIIFVSSVMGVVGEVGKTLYSMSKGALIAGSRSMALELAPKKIRVNCISPGVVQTPMSKNAIYSRDEESLARITNLHPLGLGKPEDVANTCVYLLSNASGWVTGTNLVVDGGYTAR